VIEIEGVTCRYGGGGTEKSGDGDGKADGDRVTAVANVTLSIPDGEFLIVAGANGSGKTTLVRTFNGLVTPDSGTVAVNGTPVSDDLVAARTAVGMVFQDPRDQLVASTVGADVAFGPENLGLSHAEIDRRVADALAAVNMTGREDDRIASLSGGERERVAIAGVRDGARSSRLGRAVHRLDEPARRSVLDRLRELRAAGTSDRRHPRPPRRARARRSGARAVCGACRGRRRAAEAATDLPELDVRVPEGAFDDRPVNTGADDTASDTVDS